MYLWDQVYLWDRLEIIIIIIMDPMPAPACVRPFRPSRACMRPFPPREACVRPFRPGSLCVRPFRPSALCVRPFRPAEAASPSCAGSAAARLARSGRPVQHDM